MRRLETQSPQWPSTPERAQEANAAAKAATTLVADVLIDGTGAEALSNPEILIRSGRILRIGQRTVDSPSDHEGPLLDYRGCSVIPGLIDTSVHLAASRGLPENPGRKSAAGVLIEARLRAQLALLAGATTIRDCGGRGEVTLLLREARRLGLWAGPRLILSGQPISVTSGGHGPGPQVPGVIGIRKAVRMECEWGFDSISLVVAEEEPSVPNPSLEELREAVAEAHRLHRTAIARVSGWAGMIAALDASVDMIQCAALPADSERARDLTSLASSGCLCSLGYPGPDELSNWPPPDWLVRGTRATIGVHSDAGLPGRDFELFARTLESIVRAGFASVPEAVEMVSNVPARALGLDDELGSLQPGKRADLVVVDGDLSRDAATLRRVRMVMLEGEPVVEEGLLRPPSPKPGELSGWASDA